MAIKSIINNIDPLVSVLMPAYNCDKFIKEAINSILNQSYTNLELLVADDKSRDNTKTIIDSYKDIRIRRFHNEENLGYLKTWNKLISESKGEYITFLDADDTCSLTRLEKLLKAFENNSKVGAIGSNYKRIDKNGKITYSSNLALSNKDILHKIPESFDIIGSGLMIKREVYQTIGGYNEFFNRIGAEDYYWIWLISEKYEIINISDALYFYRENPNSVSGNLSDNHKKLMSGRILNFLIQQRINYKTDALHNNKIEELLEYINKIEKPYKDDPSFLYQELAKRLFYQNDKKRALKMAFMAINKNPILFKNYRDFIYYFRKTILP